MSRYSKAVLSILIFYVGGLGLWFIDAMNVGPLSPCAIIPLAIMVLGTITCIQSMSVGMKDLISSEAFFFGIYILVRGLAFMDIWELGVFAFGMVLILAGPLMIVFASSLWAGLDYNNFRIRNVCYTVIALVGVRIFLTVLFNLEYVMALRCLSDALLLIVALNIVLLSMDRSVSQSSFIQSVRESTESMAALMYNVDDAYILRSGCQEIHALMDSQSDGQVRLKLLSNQVRNRMLIFTKTDGILRADLHATGYVHANPIYMMDVRDVVIGERYVTIYSDNGRWLRLLVFENLQEDYTKPKIFGHVIDADKLMRQMSYRMLIKENSRDQEEEERKEES